MALRAPNLIGAMQAGTQMAANIQQMQAREQQMQARRQEMQRQQELWDTQKPLIEAEAKTKTALLNSLQDDIAKVNKAQQDLEVKNNSIQKFQDQMFLQAYRQTGDISALRNYINNSNVKENWSAFGVGNVSLINYDDKEQQPFIQEIKEELEQETGIKDLDINDKKVREAINKRFLINTDPRTNEYQLVDLSEVQGMMGDTSDTAKGFDDLSELKKNYRTRVKKMTQDPSQENIEQHMEAIRTVETSPLKAEFEAAQENLKKEYSEVTQAMQGNYPRLVKSDRSGSGSNKLSQRQQLDIDIHTINSDALGMDASKMPKDKLQEQIFKRFRENPDNVYKALNTNAEAYANVKEFSLTKDEQKTIKAAQDMAVSLGPLKKFTTRLRSFDSLDDAAKANESNLIVTNLLKLAYKYTNNPDSLTDPQKAELADLIIASTKVGVKKIFELSGTAVTNRERRMLLDLFSGHTTLSKFLFTQKSLVDDVKGTMENIKKGTLPVIFGVELLPQYDLVTELEEDFKYLIPGLQDQSKVKELANNFTKAINTLPEKKGIAKKTVEKVTSFTKGLFSPGSPPPTPPPR